MPHPIALDIHPTVKPASRVIYSTEIEEYQEYRRSDGIQVNTTLCSVDNSGYPVLNVSLLYPGNAASCQPDEEVTLTFEDVRMLRNFLNRDEVVAILEGIEEK